MSNFEQPGAPVDGTGQDPGAQTTEPPAGAINTDTSQSAGPPDAIPYSRFKEVNEKYQELKDFEPLANLGYTADSLRGLAEFEAAYTMDPQDVWLRMADNIPDLPDEVKQIIARHRDTLEEGGQPVTGQPSEPTTDGPPEWAQPLVEDYQSRQVQAEDQARRDTLDSIISLWDQADKNEGVKETPQRTKLAFIAAHAATGTSPEEIAQNARAAAMEYRQTILGNEQIPVGPTGGGSPRSVPPSGVIPGTASPPKTMEEARKAALAHLQGGA